MCKRLIALLTLMTSVCLIFACTPLKGLSNSDMDIYEKIHSHYSNLKSYSAYLKFTVYSNKTENEYVSHQKALGSSKLFCKTKPENDSFKVTTVTDGKNTKTVTDSSSYMAAMPASNAVNYLFVNTFFKLYYSSEDTVLSVNSSKEGNVTVLKTAVLPKSKNVASVSLSIDNKTLEPKEITIYGIDGNAQIKGTFYDFKYNDKDITEDIFRIE